MKTPLYKSRRLILGFIFLLGSSFFISCSNYDDSEISMYYADSLPKLKVFYKYVGNKKTIKKEIRYYPNQQILSIGKFDSEYKKDGKWTYYFENRKKQRIETFKNGIKQGKNIEYYKSGKKMFSGNFTNGLPDGVWKIWNEKGIKISTTKYKNGEIIE